MIPVAKFSQECLVYRISRDSINKLAIALPK